MSFPHGWPYIGCVSGAGGSQKKACSRGMMGLKPSSSQRVVSAFNHRGVSAATFFFKSQSLYRQYLLRLTARTRLLQLEHTVDWNDGMASLPETSYEVGY